MTAVTLLCIAVLPEKTQEYFGKCQSIITLNGDFLDLTYSSVLCKKRFAQVLLPARNHPILIDLISIDFILV